MTVSMTNLNKENTRIIIGNPGCGKTTTLVEELRKASKTSPLNRIAYCSFSVAAIDEAISRALVSLNLSKESSTEKSLSKKDLPYFRTLHSMAFHLLGLNKDALMTVPQIKEFGRLTGIPVSGSTLMRSSELTQRTRQYTGDQILQIIDVARLTNQTVREYVTHTLSNNGEATPKKFSINHIEDIDQRYRDFKILEEIYDYTDMLVMAKHAELDLPELDYLFIDEAQDLSSLQWILVNRLAEKTRNIVIAGDDKQCINTFVGADVDTFLELPGKVETLNKSYRVPSTVFSLANRVVKHMHKFRKEGAVWSPREEKGKVTYCSSIPLYSLLSGDWLILTRTNYQLEPIRKRLIEFCWDFPFLFTVNGEPPIDTEIFRVIELYNLCEKTKKSILELVTVEDGDTLAEKKVKYDYIQLFKKYISCSPDLKPWEIDVDFKRKLITPWELSMDKLDKYTKKYASHLYSVYKEQKEEMFNNAKIRIMTIHAAKGREADNVIVCTDIPRSVKASMAQDNDDTEAKVFYVAITRAKQNLYIYSNNNKYGTLKRYLDS